MSWIGRASVLSRRRSWGRTSEEGLFRVQSASTVPRVRAVQYALSVREKAGVWGGATERDRRRIVRQRRQLA